MHVSQFALLVVMAKTVHTAVHVQVKIMFVLQVGILTNIFKANIWSKYYSPRCFILNLKIYIFLF